MRIDQLLVQRGLAGTRSQAQRLISAGVRWKTDGEWRTVAKNGDDVMPDAQIELLDTSEAKYVSRGGLKLAGALQQRQIRVEGLLCLDLGQSTGGFTDCLLQAGARHVVGVDVGSAQLNEVLRDDPRVTCVEGVNARNLELEDIVPALAHSEPDHVFDGFDLIVGDLAFISQTLVLPAALPMLKPGGVVLMLVKPQFELQPGQVGKGGIVTDKAMFALVERRVRDAHQALGLQVQAYFASSIQGGDGNQEYFIHSNRAQE
jgi:23S rRNA (cytidine1920-2'-O)/16S rRNA (cytidine1409-2'-O)-methyltransferase